MRQYSAVVGWRGGSDRFGRWRPRLVVMAPAQQRRRSTACQDDGRPSTGDGSALNLFSSMALLFTVHNNGCFMLLEIQYRQEDGEGVGEAISMSATSIPAKGTKLFCVILHCNYGETVDSPGEGAERVELARDLLGQGAKADGCKAVSGLADEVIAIV